jgi:putative nucleotidyltransferase with HDIG domain
MGAAASIPTPGRIVNAGMLAALLAAGVAGFATSASADWDVLLLGWLFLFAVASDLWAIDTAANPSAKHRMLMSGSFIALVLAMVLLGGAPAALIGIAMIAVGHFRFGERTDLFVNNLVAYAWFPLVGGWAFHAARDSLAIDTESAVFYALVLGVFVLALAVNFLLIAGYNSYLDGTPLRTKARKAILPVLQWDLAAAVLTATVVYAYYRLGVGALLLFGLILLSTQRLLGQVFAAEQRAEQLGERMEAFAKLHVGLLDTMIRTLDLRDRMTARHSAAVAHYAREIAAACGMSESEQEVVHTAALLHDIGKFNLPDRILKADAPLSDDDWQLIQSHPEDGANLVSHLEGYEAPAEIIRAHHEKMNGGGYPRGLHGAQIPLGARIIAVADTYDVMTARDTYRKPVSPEDAMAELRRVAGTQLDPWVVNVFIDLLAEKNIHYRHAEYADFGRELAMDKRVERYAAGVAPGA